MSLSWLHQAKQSKSKESLRRPVRLQLERLEDRLALSGGISPPNFYNGPIAPLPSVSDQVSALTAAYALTAYLPWDGPKALQSAGLQFGAGSDASALAYRSSASGPAATAWNDIMQARSLLNQEVALYNQQPQLGWADPDTYNGGHGTQQEHALASQAEQLLWDAYNNINSIPTQSPGAPTQSPGSGSSSGGGTLTLQGGVSWFENTWQQIQQWFSNALRQIETSYNSWANWWYGEGGPGEQLRDLIVPTMGMGAVGEGLGWGVKAIPGLGPLAIRAETAVAQWLGSAGTAITKFFGDLLKPPEIDFGMQAPEPVGISFKGIIAAINNVAGAEAENLVAQQLARGGIPVLGRHVTIRTSAGDRIVDFLIETEQGIVALEVKSGGAVRDATQLLKDNLMATQGGVVVGSNAPTLTGQRLIIPTVVINMP